MTPHRIAVEIFSHAIGYYLGDALKEANPDWANQLCNMGNPINVNKDDSRKALFYLVWNNPQKIKVAASAMGSPYAKYIKLRGHVYALKNLYNCYGIIINFCHMSLEYY